MKSLKEEIENASHREYLRQVEIGSVSPISVAEGFIKGAEWMQEKMQKTVERTKRETINKACTWLRKYFVEDHYGMSPSGYGVFELMFKQFMEE